MGEGLSMVVLVKQVPDPEGPPSSFRIDAEALKIVPDGIPPVISSFDENALEAALRVKEAHGGTITLLSMGYRPAAAVFLKALATGADELLLLDDPAFDRERQDAHTTSFWLAAALREMGVPDLVLAGRQASDTNDGQVGLGVAHMLGIPAVTLARKIEPVEGGIRVERVLPDGFEEVTVELPALITVSHEAGDLRFPHLRDIKAAKNKPWKTWTLGDLAAQPPLPRALKIELKPPMRERQCILIEGGSEEESGELLAMRLIRDNVI